jgi:hypothetical protein
LEEQQILLFLITAEFNASTGINVGWDARTEHTSAHNHPHCLQQ